MASLVMAVGVDVDDFGRVLAHVGFCDLCEKLIVKVGSIGEFGQDQGGVLISQRLGKKGGEIETGDFVVHDALGMSQKVDINRNGCG